MLTHSVVSYPNRGNFGDSRYRGNCTGHIIVDLIETYLPAGGLFVDPAIGGGTSKIELRCIFHAPYGSMIKYSGNIWGSPHEHDLSRMSDEQFTAALQVCLFNISDSVKPGGHYAVLMGNQRKNGRYINWSSLVEKLAPDPLVDEVIKIQHNCVSDSTQYQGRLVRIAHEKLLVFKKQSESDVLSWLHNDHEQQAKSVSEALSRAIRRILQCAGFTAEQLTGLILAKAPHYSEAFVRKVLKECPYIINDNGIYRLK